MLKFTEIATYNKLPNSSQTRAQLRLALLNETIPFYLNRFEKMASEGYIANGKVS